MVRVKGDTGRWQKRIRSIAESWCLTPGRVFLHVRVRVCAFQYTVFFQGGPVGAGLAGLVLGKMAVGTDERRAASPRKASIRANTSAK
jgi:hypothetical protein